RAVERGQIVVAANVAIADENLRHGAAPASLHHLLALGGLFVHLNLVNLNPLAREQRASALTIPAPCGRVHDDLRRIAHQAFPFLPSPLTSGKFSCRQLCSPPRRVTIFVNPALFNARAAWAEAKPF